MKDAFCSFCGQRFPVYKRAHKTCDYSTGGMEARRLPSAVHLEGLRCTGEAHGGCQAECLLFWKEAWLTQVEGPSANAATMGINPPDATLHGRARCTEANLQAATTLATEPEPVYSCQATRIPRFTTRLPPSDIDQYVEAHASRNFRLSEMPAPLLFRAYERLVRSRLGRTGVPQRVYDIFQKLRGGVPWPNRPGMIPTGQKTPRGAPLNLQPGDLVRVKSFKQILETVSHEGLNRGLLFSQELVP